MTRSQKAWAKRGSATVSICGLIFAGYLASSPKEPEIHEGIPPFLIVESNFMLDTAIVSIETNALRTNQVRQIAKHVTERNIQDRRDGAAIFFYKPRSNRSVDEPIHKIAWKKHRGFEMEY